MIHVVDTHALIWFLSGDKRLGQNAKAVLADPKSQLRLPVTALAESCWIVEHGRTAIPSVGDLMNDVDSDIRLDVVPLTKETIILSLTLTSIREMHDRQIVATALWLSQQGDSVALVTRDENIKQAGIIPVVW